MDTTADDDDDPMLDGSREAGAPEASSPESEGGRDSGIVEVERKASAVTGGVTGALASTLRNGTSDPIPTPAEPEHREHDIEIDTELGEGPAPRAQMITQTVVTNGASKLALESVPLDRAALDLSALNVAALDDDAIQVSDDEIESAEPRPTLTSGLHAFAGTSSRSRPPAPPSLRPRGSSTSLPPPRPSTRVGAMLRSSLPPPSFASLPHSGSPSERDPWLLANKTLELSRANARISTLEDQLAFRDARILTLEERLDAAQLKIEELERQRDLLPIPASTVAAVSLNAPAVSQQGIPGRAASKPVIAIPKPADLAKLADAKLAPGPAVNGKSETRRDDAQDALTPDAPDAVSESIPPEADEELANTAAAPPSGPEDVTRIAGIGARFEAALRKQGITRISQIAAWSDADVRQIAKALKIPKSRILKGRWVEAAREMIGSRSTSE